MTVLSDEVQRAFSGLSGASHVLTIGNFDGLHRGHRHLLASIINIARQRNVRSLVVTFEPHPIAVLRPDHAPPRISTPAAKLQLLAHAGIDDIVVIPFDRDFASLTADEFLDLIKSRCNPTDVLVGEGFRFGKMRAGTTESLRTYGLEHGFETIIVDPLEDDAGVVSSSRIRDALQHGDIATASKLLGRRFRLCGAVEHGMARGRDLGYPTANLGLPEGLCVPGDGIYVGYAHLDDRAAGPREALIYVGTSPTFGDRERIVEVNILDFRGDLYSQDLEIEFLAFIRPDTAFGSADELTLQMADDESAARKILASSNPEETEKGST